MENDSNKLFRQEVLDAKKNSWTGNIIILRPISFRFLTASVFFLMLFFIIFLFSASYTKRSTVQGQLTPKSGLIQVYSTLPGIVSFKNVYEGKLVHKGDVLYVISTTNYGEKGDITASFMEQANLKDQLIKNEIIRLRLTHLNEKRLLVNQINSLNNNLNQIKIMLINQNNRMGLAKINKDRYEVALNNNAVSHEDFEIKNNNYLDQLSQYKALERERITQEQNLNEQRINLNGLKNKQENEIEDLKRTLSTNSQEAIQMEAKQSINIIANTSGIVSTVNAENGQYIDQSKPLISILPDDTQLIALLYVPSQSIGFVKVGDSVLLRYKAYPYQKFGHATAKIISVARTALAGKDLTSIGTISPEEQLNNEPIYLVRAKLDKQSIEVYGKENPLQVGMTCEGDILNENRKLYEWALEPLFSITGKI